MNRPLQDHLPMPLKLAFVLRLHQDSQQPGRGLCGSVEHLISGWRAEFANLLELQRRLEEMLSRLPASDSETRQPQE
ncbi:hypothetical protein [Piscinibacter sp. XHJ-5]|uniref:hypothetical protein n=1 Tax=Piscinibacter sp. XHJ-5 TaxID=3037797 RepID=UPI0024529FD2|nr:hypothetical protein [Piscinibacter sp. XHJ-5]